MQRLPASFGSYVEKGAATILLLALSVAIVIYFVHAVLSVSHPYPLDYGEAPLIDQAMRLAAGQTIYRPGLSSPPYTISNYPPLYVLSLAPFVKLFGPTFLAGRAISVLCALASAIFVALIIYSQTKDRVAAATSGMFLLAIPYVVYWSSLARIDLLALALSLAGLYLLARWPTARWSTVASALLLVAAIYTRQSYALAAPLAAFVWLWTRDRRQALRRSLSRAEPILNEAEGRRGSGQAIGLAAMVGGLALILFLILNTLTRGGFYFNIVTANVNEFGIERLEWNLRRLRDAAPILLVMGGAFLVLAPAGRMRTWPLLVPYLIGSALSALTIGKIGSNVNYFLELSAALSLAAGALVAWTRQHRWLRVVLLVLLALQARQLMQTTLDVYAERLRGRLQSVQEIRELEEIVADAEGPVLADEYMGLVTLQGRPLYIQPFEVTQLANAGLWDQTPFVESIRDKEFSLILVYHHPKYAGLHKERWTPEMLSAISRAYALVDLVADTYVYRATGSRTLSSAACPDAPWQLPTSGDLGVQWSDAGLDFFGLGNENSVPVYAVADGLLTRLPDWKDAVAIQHDDPLRPGERVWSYYAHMASANAESYIAQDYPAGSANVPVQAGQLLGYQGRWSGQTSRPIWLHLRFSVVRPAADGSFPGKIVPQSFLDPSPYLGIAITTDEGQARWQPLHCKAGKP